MKTKHLQNLSMFFVTAALLAVLFFVTVSLSGCGKNNEGNSQNVDNTETGAGRGRFIETKLALPDEVTGLFAFRGLDDGTLEAVGRNDNYAPLLLKSRDDGQTWEVTELDSADYSDVAIAGDGTVALLPYTENGIVKIQIFDTDGNKSEVEAEVGAAEDGDENYLCCADFDSEKRLIVLDLRGNVYAIDLTDGSLGKPFETDDAWISYFKIVGTKCIAVTDGKILIFDTATGEKTGEDAVLGGLVAEDENLVNRHSDSGLPVYFAEAEDENGILVADYKGVYHSTFGASVSEQLIAGDQTSLGVMGTVIYGVYMQDANHIFVALDNGMESAIYCYTYDASAQTTASRELTVYALEDTITLRQAVNIFQIDHPDIYVNFEIGMSGEDGVTAGDALAALSTDIMAGNGPDVLILDGMPVDSYIEKGILTDIRDVVNEVEDEDGLLTNIVTDNTRSDKIYAIPSRILVTLIDADESTAKKSDTLENFADCAEQLAAAKKTKYVMNEIMAKQLLTEFYNADSANWLTEGKSLDEAKLKNYLTQAKRVYDVDDHTDAETSFNYSWSGIDSGYIFGAIDYRSCMGTSSLSVGSISDISDFQPLVSEDRQTGNTFQLFDTKEGGAYVPFLQVGVVSGGNEEAAKAFVKTLLGKEAGASSNGIPINVTALKSQLEDLTKPTETAISWGDAGDDEIYSLDYVALTDEEVDRITAMLESVSRSALNDRTIQELVITEGEKYLKDEQSLEDTAAAIIKKVNLYLAE